MPETDPEDDLSGMIYSPEASDGTFDWPTKIVTAVMVILAVALGIGAVIAIRS